MDKGDTNRVALALIVNKNDDILFGRRQDNGRYTIPGGHLKENESPFDGMKRELKEETGLDALDLKLVKIGQKGVRQLHLFIVRVDPDQKADPSGDPDQECDFWEYLNPNDAVHNLHVKIEDNIVLHYWAYEMP